MGEECNDENDIANPIKGFDKRASNFLEKLQKKTHQMFPTEPKTLEPVVVKPKNISFLKKSITSSKSNVDAAAARTITKRM